MALAGERSELPGHRRQHAGFNNCVEGAYGIARFAEREAVDSDDVRKSTCGVRDPRRRLVRRWVWRWTVAGGGRRRWFVGGDRTIWHFDIRQPNTLLLQTPQIGRRSFKIAFARWWASVVTWPEAGDESRGSAKDPCGR